MTLPVPDFPPLHASASADVCVVGAGLAGLTTAYLLGRKGRRVIVVDAGPIASGMSSRTTAHLMSAIDDRYLEIERLHGEEGARLAADSHSAAIDAIEAIVRQERIDCDFARVDGYLFLPPGGDPDVLLDEYAASLRAGLGDVRWVDRAPFPHFDSGRCLRYPRQGQFHPVKYLSGLAHAIVRDGGAIHCGVAVERVEDGARPRVHLRSGHVVDCAQVVIATNSPITDHVAIHTKQAPYLTYVVALRVPKGTVDTALWWDTLDSYHYARLDRPGGEVLIVGGEDHKTGQADDSERRFANLELWARERFPAAREVLHRWMGQVMETVDGLAYIGRDPGARNIYIATGDSGMGMTHGTIAGLVLTDLLHGVEVPWAALYDPSRKALAPGAVRAYARENANVAMQYAALMAAGEVDSVEEIAPGQGALVGAGPGKQAVYRDESGELHAFSARCTHLGCPVHWNAADRTWDCRCHGSRFDATGHVVTGPAHEDLAASEPPTARRVGISRQPGASPPTRPG